MSIQSVVTPILYDGDPIIVNVSGIAVGEMGVAAVAIPFSLTQEFSDGELARDETSNNALYISLADGNLGNPLNDTNFWALISSGTDSISFVDTPNDGNVLGVDFVNTGGVISATVLNNNTPHPAAQVSATASRSSVEEGFTDPQTVTYTVNVGPAGDFSFDAITSAHASVGTTSVLANEVVLTIPVSANTPRTITTNITLTYTNDDDGTVHTDILRETFTIAGSFGTLLSTTPPTALTDFSNLAVWTGNNTQTFTGNNTGRTLYYIMPTRTNGYTFKTGPLFIIPTASSVIGDHTLYTIGDFDDSQDGSTFILTVTET